MKNQYIELYTNHRTRIKEHCADLINDAREKAIQSFDEEGFPRFGSEEWQHTNVSVMFEPDYGINIEQVEYRINPYDAFHCDVPNLSTQLYFLINDSFYTEKTPKTTLPKGVLIGSLNKMAAAHPELLAPYYNKLASKATNEGQTHLNTAFVQDGFLLYIPKNCVIEKPIQLVSLMKSNIDRLINRRLLIIVEEGANAKLLICDHAMDEQNCLLNQVTEVFVGANASIDIYELEETNERIKRIAAMYVQQEASSSSVINGISLMNGETRNSYHVTLTAPGADVVLSGMSILDKKQRCDTHVVVDHAAPHCTSNQLFKNVLDDQSHGAFHGRVIVREGAQKSVAYQSNKNLCISKEAIMATKPQLEIYADDVKCSHGATVGQLDEAALFYMRARGLSEDEARMLLKFAFTSDVIDTVRMDALKDRLHLLIEKRFRGELARCATCSSCK